MCVQSPIKDFERFTFEKSSLSLGLIKLLDMPVCSQVSLGYCNAVYYSLLCSMQHVIFKGEKFPWKKQDTLSLKHPVAERGRRGSLLCIFSLYTE